MSEKKIQWIQLIKLAVVITCAMLYGFGGVEHKWLRRFLAPSIAGATMFAFARDWKILIKMPFLILSSCLGYGADEFWLKILKRSNVGMNFGLAVSSYEAFFKKQYIYLAMTCLICTTAFICLGVFNPFIARIEETMLGLIIYGLAIMPANKEEK